MSYATYLAVGLSVWLLRRTLRVRLRDPHGVLEDASDHWPFIGVLWHNRLLVMPTIMPRSWRRRVAILASASRDGEYAAGYMRFFGYRPIRGSTSKGGVRALRVLRRHLCSGLSVGLTPDGPRGPRYQVQAGVVALSQMTGRPVVPFNLNAPRRWELRGWDRTQIPKPFSRVEFVLGRPITVPAEANEAERAEWREEVRRAMLEITED